MNRFKLRYLYALGTIEGLSMLFLLFVAMPMRAITHDPTFVKTFGQVHGILFLMYVYSLATYGLEEKWAKRTILIGFVCAVVPFAVFWFDRKFLVLSSRTLD